MEPAVRFLAKGVAFAGAMTFAEKMPGGLDAVRVHMPVETRDRIEPFYVASGWYDVDVLADLMTAIALVGGGKPARVIREQAARAAKSDVEGLYRQTLKAHHPAEMARRLPRAFNRYFSPSCAEYIRGDATSFETVLAPVPAHRADFFTAMNEGFVAGALETTGVTGVFFEWTRETHGTGHLAQGSDVTEGEFP